MMRYRLIPPIVFALLCACGKDPNAELPLVQSNETQSDVDLGRVMRKWNTTCSNPSSER
jgi:hypothetical protein